jgi:hypothetical protein
MTTVTESRELGEDEEDARENGFVQDGNTR